ncbi:MAG: hypothetical protein KDD85_02610 [Parvularculaceae bacterium]|nr:hypothetical protein [Parvularculaceae bacterium]
MRKIILVATAFSVAALAPAGAFAGGRHGGHYAGYHGGYYGGYYGGYHGARHYRPHHYNYGYYPYYSRHGYYNHRRYRGGRISGGEAALIAAGIVGGVILIDRALDNRTRYDRDRYDERYYDNRRYSDRYRRGAFPDDDYYYQRDDRFYDGRDAERPYDGREFYAPDNRSSTPTGELDERLLGGGDRNPQSARLIDAAFRECVAETRGAAGAGGMQVAMPGAPTRVETLADGSVRMSAQFRASNARGDSWTRRFTCETDGQGVRFLQVD